MSSSSNKYHPVAGLLKGLTLLEILARHGDSSVLRLADLSGIPRPTVHRLLQTLVQAGYVSQHQRGGTYSLEQPVRSLADGYKSDDWIFSAATPVLAELRKHVAWPNDVAINMAGAMTVCASTHDQNSLSLERVVRGRRVAMLSSALGRAYLAFCPASEREALLESLRPSNEVERMLLETPELLRRELAATRERGYGVRDRGIQPRTSSIAVPVMYNDWVVACVNIHWIASAMSVETAVERFLPHLKAAAQQLETVYVQFLREDGSIATPLD